MQSVSTRIWTCVAVFISNDDNHYTTGTSKITQRAVPMEIVWQAPLRNLWQSSIRDKFIVREFIFW